MMMTFLAMAFFAAASKLDGSDSLTGNVVPLCPLGQPLPYTIPEEWNSSPYFSELQEVLNGIHLYNRQSYFQEAINIEDVEGKLFLLSDSITVAIRKETSQYDSFSPETLATHEKYRPVRCEEVRRIFRNSRFFKKRLFITIQQAYKFNKMMFISELIESQLMIPALLQGEDVMTASYKIHWIFAKAYRGLMALSVEGWRDLLMRSSDAGMFIFDWNANMKAIFDAGNCLFIHDLLSGNLKLEINLASFSSPLAFWSKIIEYDSDVLANCFLKEEYFTAENMRKAANAGAVKVFKLMAPSRIGQRLVNHIPVNDAIKHGEIWNYLKQKCSYKLDPREVLNNYSLRDIDPRILMELNSSNNLVSHLGPGHVAQIVENNMMDIVGWILENGQYGLSKGSLLMIYALEFDNMEILDKIDELFYFEDESSDQDQLLEDNAIVHLSEPNHQQKKLSSLFENGTFPIDYLVTFHKHCGYPDLFDKVFQKMIEKSNSISQDHFIWALMNGYIDAASKILQLGVVDNPRALLEIIFENCSNGIIPRNLTAMVKWAQDQFRVHPTKNTILDRANDFPDLIEWVLLSGLTDLQFNEMEIKQLTDLENLKILKVLVDQKVIPLDQEFIDGRTDCQVIDWIFKKTSLLPSQNSVDAAFIQDLDMSKCVFLLSKMRIVPSPSVVFNAEAMDERKLKTLNEMTDGLISEFIQAKGLNKGELLGLIFKWYADRDGKYKVELSTILDKISIDLHSNLLSTICRISHILPLDDANGFVIYAKALNNKPNVDEEFPLSLFGFEDPQEALVITPKPMPGTILNNFRKIFSEKTKIDFDKMEDDEMALQARRIRFRQLLGDKL